MKRYLAPLLLLFALGCTENPASPVDSIPSAALTREAGTCSIDYVAYGDGYEYQVGPVWRWVIEGSLATDCGGPLHVTLFFVNNDESREMFGSGWVFYREPSYMAGGQMFAIDGKAPSFDWEETMLDENHAHWRPMFEAEITRNGQMIGRYRFNIRVQLPPNVLHGRASHFTR